MKKILFALVAVGILAGAATAERLGSSGENARKLWKALDLMAKLEDLPIMQTDGSARTISVRSLTCASEMQQACSFFVNLNGEEKLIVHTDAASKIVDALYDHGIYPEEDDPSLSQSVKRVTCVNDSENYRCALEEWQ